jgi:hypothetical protein
MTQVFVARHPTEAHLVRGLLEASGIAAEVHGESLFGARGEAPVTEDTLPTVWVSADEDAARARDVLADYESQKTGEEPSGAPWTCATCGESVEAQFTACWNCGTPRM